MIEYELVRDGDKIWAHSINARSGKVSKAGSRRTEEEAAEMVASGEARWAATAAPANPASERLKKIGAAIRNGSARAHYSDDEILEAVNGGYASAADAMNQDS